MQIIDSHAHLMDEMYQNDVTEVIKRCEQHHMEYLINIGYDEESSYQAVDFAKRYDFMYATVGLHPDACNIPDVSIEFLKELARNPKVVAIGEIGLDYHYEETDRENQKRGFVKQIQLANNLQLPVVIHSRDADMDMLSLLKENRIDNGFVMHCFSSSVEIAREVLRLGGYVSFAGTVTFKNAKTQKEVAQMVPIEKLLIETDAPYLTPEPYRGTRNEPWHVIETAKAIADIKKMPLEDFLQIVNQNIKNFYQIV